MLRMEPTRQARVMQHFSPKPGTRDVNRLFHGLVKSFKDFDYNNKYNNNLNEE